MCVGEATKIAELLTADDKEYIAGVKLGIETDSYDIDGNILDQKEVPNNLPIKKVVQSFQKTYLQEVPIYSAVKVKGKKLYEYARNNIEVELPKKKVTIKSIELLDQTKDTFTFKAEVTKGCYIRSLIHDMGKELYTYAMMTSLVRTRQGNITLDKSVTIEEFKNKEYRIYSIEDVLNIPTVVVDERLAFKIKNGQKINNKWNIKKKVLFKDKNNNLLGIYEVEEHILKVWKNFSQEK